MSVTEVYAAALQSPSGEMLHAGAGFYWDFTAVWADWGLGDYFFWSPEDKARYHSTYQKYPTRISPEGAELSQEEALLIAQDAALHRFGIQAEQLATDFRVDSNLIPAWSIRQEHDAWVLLFKSRFDRHIYQVTLSSRDGTVYACTHTNEAM